MPKPQKKITLSPLANGYLIGAFALAASAGIIYSAFFRPEPETVIPAIDAQIEQKIIEAGQEQHSGTVAWDQDGRTYTIWEGVFHEELNNNIGHDSFSTAFDNNVYDFDLGVIIHVADEDSGGLTRTYFKDANPEHIERVREAAKIIAEWYIRLSKTEEYSTAPADVLAFYERHCQPTDNSNVAGATVKEDNKVVDNLLLDDLNIAEGILKAGKEQKTAQFYQEDSGRRYVIWDGLIIEELDNRKGHDSFSTGFDNHIYDFDLGVVYHVGNGSRGQIDRSLFSEVNSQHIEHVRSIGRTLAEGYIKRSRTTDYTGVPEDVLAFYERHCVGIGRETDLSEIEAGLLADMDVSDEIIKKGEPQKPASYHISDAGRTYTLWDGVIVEELHNNTGFKNFGTSFDNNVYDFDLGVIIHTANEDSGGITRTRFKDADPAHIEHVRKIGLRIAEGYIKRSLTEEHSSAPDDVIAFYKRHYALQTASNEIVQETASKPQPIAP